MGIALIIWCSGVFFNGYVGIGEQVHAEPAITTDWTATATTPVADTMSIRQILNMVLKLIYLLLWPLLVVAGLALDNTLVYASIFHLDAPLWKFWNMMKNFANFTLWFMVLFAIIKSIVTNTWAWSAKDQKSPLGIIKTTLIAGILIQASRFIVAALVDVSTIATYAIGGLPLNVLKNTAIGNQKILSVNSQLDLNKFNLSFGGGKEFQVWYSTKHPWIKGDKVVTMSPCRVERSYVIWREYGEAQYKNTAKFVWTEFEWYEVCVLSTNQLVMWKEDELMWNIKLELDKITWPEPGYLTDIWYKYYIKTLLNITWWNTKTERTKSLVYLGSWNIDPKWVAFFSGTDSLTIATLIQKSKGFVGPLVTIYSSLLNFAQLTDASVTTTSWTSGVFIIKALVAIALFFPLIALALVLILRVWILRMYIVASPFIILKASFKDFIKIKSLDEYLSVTGVIGIIFAPVITVAALSISLIFMTALVNGFSANDSRSAINDVLGIQSTQATSTWNDAVSIGWWIASLEFSRLPWWDAMDWFSWLMVNFFAIGLMWMIVFAAIRANELGKSVGSTVEDFGSKFFQTLPILPIGWWVGIGSAATVLKWAPDTRIRQRESAQRQIADEYVFGTNKDDTSTWTTAPTTISTTQATNFIKANSTSNQIKTAVQDLWVKEANIGTVLNSSYENLYAAVNTLSETDRPTVISAITGAWATSGWEKPYKAKADFDTFIRRKNPTDKGTLSDIFETTDTAEQALITQYFTDANINTYKTTVNGTEYTVTKTTSVWPPPVVTYTTNP